MSSAAKSSDAVDKTPVLLLVLNLLDKLRPIAEARAQLQHVIAQLKAVVPRYPDDDQLQQRAASVLPHYAQKA